VGKPRAGALTWLVVMGVLCARSAAAQFSLHSEVDAQKVGVQDQVQLSITLTGGTLPNPPMPTLMNLRVIGGPSLSTQMSFVNGAVSQSQTFTYVLQPEKVGSAEIGEVRVKAGSTDHVAPPIPIEVVAGSIRPRSAGPDPFDPFGGGDPFESLRRRGGRTREPGGGAEPKLFLEAALGRNRVHVGEPVLLTYYLYTQTSVSDLRFSEPPKFGGFWMEELEKPSQVPGGEPVAVNGERYQRFPLFQKLLFPTKAGTATIPPATIKIGIPRGFFDMPGADVVERSTKPLTLTVDPIPEEPGFSGAVGRFTASANVDRTTAGLGEAVTLRFEVQGNGNLKWIDRGPELKVPGAKVYPPQIKSDLHTSPAGIAGTKTWEFIIVPETSGTLEIPALAFAYFDLEKQQLAHATTAPVRVQVQGGAGNTAAAPSVATRSSGPLPLRSDLDLPSRALTTLPARALGGAVVLVLLAHGLLWASPAFLERRGESGGRPARGRGVRRALSDLERAGRDGMSKEASVSLIEKTLHDVFGPLDEDSSAPESDRERAAREVLQGVSFIRYAPQLGDYSEQIRDVARRAAEVVKKWG
jgi:hypothetical protein